MAPGVHTLQRPQPCQNARPAGLNNSREQTSWLWRSPAPALVAGRLAASHPRGWRCPQHRCSVRGPDTPDVGSACGPYYICAIVPNFHALEMMVLVRYILPRRQGILALTQVQLFPQKVTLNYYRRLLRRSASFLFFWLFCRPVSKWLITIC